MWILDTTVERDRVALWGPGGAVGRTPVSPSFLVTLADPHSHWGLVDALETAFGAEPVTVRTIHGEGPGWRVGSGRETAAAILRQTEFGARCYNVDVAGTSASSRNTVSSPAPARARSGSRPRSARTWSGWTSRSTATPSGPNA